jgi:hemolysin activation/secretion protein
MTINNKDSFAMNTHFTILRPVASSFSIILAALAALFAVASAFAQTPPNAGQLLQQERTAPQLPQTAPALRIQPPASLSLLPGGVTVTLQGVRFNGNTVFSAEQLAAALGEVTGKSFDMAGLQGLAQRLSEHYRAGGYPFARAYLPEQKFADGVLTLTVLEGRYGQVTTAGDAALAVPARHFLAYIKPGAVIETAALERATLVLGDLPGIKTAPIIRPGQELGAGDLVVEVSRTPGWRGDVGMDNYGNRYTGEYRLRLNLTVDCPFTFGDQLTLRSLVSHTGQWLGNLGYSLPIGGSGLRGNVGYAHTYYELGEQFASLGATGTADITTLGWAGLVLSPDSFAPIQSQPGRHLPAQATGRQAGHGWHKIKQDQRCAAPDLAIRPSRYLCRRRYQLRQYGVHRGQSGFG